MCGYVCVFLCVSVNVCVCVCVLPVVPVVLFEGVKVGDVHLLALPCGLVVGQVPPLDQVVRIALLIRAAQQRKDIDSETSVGVYISESVCEPVVENTVNECVVLTCFQRLHVRVCVCVCVCVCVYVCEGVCVNGITYS